MAQLLIQRGADINAEDQGGRTPLYTAIGRQHLGMTRLLISKGAALNVKDQDGYTPLFWAAFTGGDKDVLDLILAQGGHPDTIHLAACRGDLDRVRTLVERGTNVDIEDEFRYTPLHWAIAGRSREVTDYLLDKGADPNLRNGRGFTALMIARDVPMLELLVSKGADTQSKTPSGVTKLHMVCSSGDRDAAEFLVRNGAEINARTANGVTPLLCAAIGGHTEIVELLINKGADINLPLQDGATPIARANQRGHTEVVNILRRHGATETLHAAVASGDKEGVKRLVEQGADLNTRNQNGETPLHLALSTTHGGLGSAVFLIGQGADVDAKTSTGRTPLMLAAIANLSYQAEVLIGQGADANAKDNTGETALSLARENGHPEIVELLCKHGATE